MRSGGECRGDKVLVDFRGHDFGPKGFGLALAKRGFHVEIKKSVKEDQGQKCHEQEAFDSSSVVLQNMVGVPPLDQLIEAVIFDVPSLMPKTDYSGHGNLRRWQRGYPYPIAGLQFVLFVQLTPYRVCLQRTNHS